MPYFFGAQCADHLTFNAALGAVRKYAVAGTEVAEDRALVFRAPSFAVYRLLGAVVSGAASTATPWT